MIKEGDWVRVSEPHTYFTGRVGKVTRVDPSELLGLTWVDVLIDGQELAFDISQISLFEPGPLDLEHGAKTRDRIQREGESSSRDAPEFEDL